jgi:hypothetical protein
MIERGGPFTSAAPACDPHRSGRRGRLAAICLIGVLLTGLGGCDDTERHGQAGEWANVQGSASVGPMSLSCEPSKLAHGDTLVLRMSHPHGPYLAVRKPDGTQFFLAYPTLGDTTAPPPIIANEAFMETRELRLATSDVVSSPWTAAEIVPQHVFTASGTYEITLAENLESDAEYPSVQCTVHFSGRPMALPEPGPRRSKTIR